MTLAMGRDICYTNDAKAVRASRVVRLTEAPEVTISL
jgi:ethanolamine ammonia-lyase large subunit